MKLHRHSIIAQDIVRRKDGCVYHGQNSDAHEDMKWEVYKFFKKRGYRVYTECVFKDGKRADVFVLELALIVEIETNQHPDNIKKKKANYDYSWLSQVVVLDPTKPEDLWETLESQVIF